jgi:hypothetical protein
MPALYYTDINNTWVFINGRRIQTSRYTYDNNNHLTVTDVSNGEKVLVTAMVDGGSPNPTAFKMIVGKSGENSVYRTNPQERTWLTSDFGPTDTTMYVSDINRLVEVVTITNTIGTFDPSINLDNDNDIGFLLSLNISEISHIEGYNISEGVKLTRDQIELEVFKGTSGVAFYGSNVALGDVIQLTIYIGNILETNGERMRFTILDPVANAISGITRNVQHTVSTTHKEYDYVYGLGSSRKLISGLYAAGTNKQPTYNTLWKSSDYVEFGDPLSISSTDAALFLNASNK